MAIHTEVERIVKKHISSDIWQYGGKKGWINECVFRNSSVDTHNLLIKLGQSMEQIIPDIARLKYPGSLFPRSIAGFGVSEPEAKEYFSKRFEADQSLQKNNAVIILTRLSSDQMKAFLAAEVDKRIQQKKRGRVRFSQGNIKELSEMALQTVPLTDEIREVYVDLCPHIISDWTLIEVKTTGNTDKGKTRDMFVHNMMEPYICIGKKPKKLYFGVVSDNLGSNRFGEWKGQLSAYVEPDMVLLEEQLFDLIAPSGVPFEDFQEMVCERLGRTKRNHKTKSVVKRKKMVPFF